MATTTTTKMSFHVKHSAFSAETRRGTGSRRGMKRERIEVVVVVVVFRLAVFPPLFCEDFDFIRIIMNIGEAPLKYFCLVGNK